MFLLYFVVAAATPVTAIHIACAGRFVVRLVLMLPLAEKRISAFVFPFRIYIYTGGGSAAAAIVIAVERKRVVVVKRYGASGVVGETCVCVSLCMCMCVVRRAFYICNRGKKTSLQMVFFSLIFSLSFHLAFGHSTLL